VFVGAVVLLICPHIFNEENQMRGTNVHNQTTWRQLFANAVAEVEPLFLEAKLAAAQRAIKDRSVELVGSGGDTELELRELAVAHETIKHLRKLDP
jgi:hypothetical protein